MKSFSVLKIIIFALLAFYIVLVVIFLIMFFLKLDGIVIGTDLVSFLTGAKIVRNGDAKLLYDINTQLSTQLQITSPKIKDFLLPFRGFPFVALFYIPLTFLSLNNSFIIITFINLFLLAILICGIYIYLPNLRKKIFGLLLLVFYWPVANTIIVGQYSLILPLNLLAIYVFLKRKNALISGIFSGIFIIKPQFMLLAPYIFLLTENKKKFVLGLAIAILPIVLIGIYLSGISHLWIFPRFLAETETISYGSRYFHMYTFQGFLLRLNNFFRMPLAFLLLINFSAFFISLFMFKTKIKSTSIDFIYVSAILLTIIFSVHLLNHDLVAMLIPMSILMNKFESKKGRINTNELLFLFLYFLPFLSFFGATNYATPILVLVSFYLLKNS